MLFRFADAAIFCPYQKTLSYVDLHYLALVHNVNITFDFVMEVNRPPDANSQRQYTVCLEGTMFNYSDYKHVVQWIELNRIFGAEHFIFYIDSASDLVMKYLSYYKHKGLATLYNWVLPAATIPSVCNMGVRCLAQLSLNGDCWARTWNRSEYAVQCQLDEFIVPRSSGNWSGMIQKARCAEKQIITARQTTFHTDAKDDALFQGNDTVNEHQLNVLLKTERQDNFTLYPKRSKSIIDPTIAEKVDVHSPRVYHAPRDNICVLDPEDGALHQYRGLDGPSKDPRVTDRHMHRFSDDLIKRVVSIHKDVHNFLQSGS